MKFIISICLLFAPAAFADHTGFKSGNSISIVTLHGSVYMTCHTPMPPTWKHFNCWDEIVTPASSDKFQMHEPVDADKVTLSVTHRNGKTVTKTEKYNSKKNESGNFNLTINTLFQKALLELGNNTVTYTLTKKGEEVATGSFVATAAVTEERECRHKNMYGSYNDCTNQVSACNYYFYSENYCKY